MFGRRTGYSLLMWLLLLLPLGGVQAADVKVVFSSHTPPYVFQQSNDGRPGILVEIVEQALSATGHTVKPVFLPLGRGFKLLEEMKVDVISISKRKLNLKAYFSDVSIEYHNYAIGLESRQMAIEGIGDLQDKSIIAFQKADIYLGDEFNAAVAGNPGYVEMANQENQVQMLLKGRTDVAVMDRSIFEFYRNKLASEGLVSRDIPVRFYNLFEPTRYRAAFADEALRDQFNLGLKEMRDSGAYQAIYNKYLREYFIYMD